jgi:uncharacterized protein (TIGR02996 family)
LTTSQSETRRHLLAEVLAYPGSDAPRLVMADWLDEHGDPDRAEFIRLECDIARICRGNREGKPEPDAKRLKGLMSQECGLMWGVWQAGWCDPVPRDWLSDAVINRGFVAEVRCTAAAWLEHGRAVCACQPVEQVVLSDREPMMRQYHGHPPRWFWQAAEGETTLRCPVPGRLLVYLVAEDYPSREAALADLSRAALAFARAAAPERGANP